MYQAHTLVTFGGKLAEKAGNDEIWQVGIRGFQQGGGQVDEGSLADLAMYVLRGPTGAGGGLEGIWTDGGGRIGQGSTLAWCKAANIGPDGKYTGAPGIAECPAVAGDAPPAAPSFCCIAVSWTTPANFGKAQKGRIYLPCYGAELNGASSSITAAAVNAIGAFAQNVLKAVDCSSTGFNFNPYVVSESGVSNPITGIRVGNVYDVQRRRKNASPETYTTFPILGPSGDG